jgi:hypothetical protein
MVRVPAGAGDFSLHHRIQTGSGAHPASYPMGTSGSLPEEGVLKQLGREADHSPPSSAEVKNAWSYTSAPPVPFMAWCLVKHRDNFTFLTFTVLSKFFFFFIFPFAFFRRRIFSFYLWIL